MVASSVDTERLFGVRPQNTLWIWIGVDVTMLGLQAVGGGLAGTHGGDPVSVRSFQLLSLLMIKGNSTRILHRIAFT